MRTTKTILLILSFLIAPYACRAASDRDVIYQISTIDALISGLYDGDTTFGELKQHGDFGIGTFNQLDGEMMLLDGTVYHIVSDGTVHIMPDSQKTPFAAVTYL